jgi:hypothetical protein
VRPIVFTVVPLLALGASLAWATVHVHRVEGRGEPQLYRRALEWEERLSVGPRSSAVELVHPAVRGHPRLSTWLANIERQFAGSRGSQILESKVVGAGEGEATYAIDIGAPTRRLPTVEFRWERAQDGLWYVVPRSL